MTFAPGASNLGIAVQLRRLGPWLVFAVALGVRLGYAVDIARDPEDALYNFHSVQGVPFSDAQSWEMAAAEVSLGRPVPSYWQGRRPIYYWFLAAIYAWTGPSFTIALALNLLLSAAMAALLFQIGTRFVSLPAGLSVALWSIFDPETLIYSMQLLTETLGALLVVWHFWLLVRGVDRGGWALAASGVVFSLSNLTRVLTLLALPGTVVLIALIWLRGRLGWTKALFAAAAFALGAIAPLAPFLFEQWWKFGVVSFQDSSAQHLFAVTSPDFGIYKPEVELLANERGLTGVAERYRFYQRAAWDNLRRYPGFFVRNIAHHLHHWFIRSLPTRRPRLLAFVLVVHALGCTVTLARETARRADNRRAWQWRAALWGAGWLAVLGIGLRAVPIWLVSALLLAALVEALCDRRCWPALLAANLVVFTLASLALSAWDDDRVMILFQWADVLMVLGALERMYSSSWRRLVAAQIDRQPADASRWWLSGVPEAGIAAGRWLRWGFVFLVASWLRTSLNGMVWPMPPDVRHDLADAQRAVEEVCRRRPWLIAARECANVSRLSQLTATHDETTDDGKLLVLTGRVSRYIYDFPRGARTHAHWRQFRHRPYERTVFLFSGHDFRGRGWFNFCVMPGTLPNFAESGEVMLVARASVSPEVYQQYVLEGIVLAPWSGAVRDSQKKENPFAAQFDAAVWGDAPRHRRFLDEASTR